MKIWGFISYSDHDNPSGIPSPFEQDILLIHELCIGGNYWGVEVSDYTIIGFPDL